MGITYRAKHGEYTLHFSGADNAVLKSATVTGRYSGRTLDGSALFGVFPGEQSSIERIRLLTAAEDLLARIEGELPLLQYAYSFRAERPLFGSIQVSTGIQIGDKVCSLETGMGTCILTEYGKDEEGKLHLVGRVDVRSRETIETDNMGKIAIIKKRRPLTIHAQLRGLTDFLRRHPDETITKILDGGKVSLGEIIAGCKEGVVDEEWMRKHLHLLGSKASGQLQKYLKRATEEGDRRLYQTLLDLMAEENTD